MRWVTRTIAYSSSALSLQWVRSWSGCRRFVARSGIPGDSSRLVATSEGAAYLPWLATPFGRATNDNRWDSRWDRSRLAELRYVRRCGGPTRGSVLSDGARGLFQKTFVSVI